MICPSCQQTNNDEAEICFFCGKALHALTQGFVLAARYVIRQPLGRGGMGYVYRAHDRMLEEDVAIKVVRAELVRDSEMARRFRNEIRLARKVSHPNICRIHEYGEDGNIRYLSMEFVDGVELKRLLRDGPLPPALGLEVAAQAAEGLQAVHAHGIIHRDLKPSNIMIDRRGIVRLMDFGIAKEAESSAGLTGTGQMMGTPEYMSPEQARGDKAGYPSDVYALGCALYEVFIGVPPFHSDTPLSTLHMHLNDPPPLGGREGRVLPPALAPLLRNVLAKEPAERYTSAEFAVALRSVQGASSASAADLATTVAAVAGPPSAIAAEGTHSGTVFVPDPATPASVTPERMVTTTLDNVGRPRTRPGSRAGVSRGWALGVAAGAAAMAAALALSVWSRDRAQPVVEPSPGTSGPTPPALGGRDTSSVAPGTEGTVPGGAPAPTRTTPAPSLRPQTSPARTPDTGAPAAAPTVAAVPPAAGMGTLSLVVVPPAVVTVDGTALGLVSLREVPLAAGDHTVRIEHPDFKPLLRKVSIQPGLTERLVLDLEEKAIRKRRGSDN